jgi:YVTN family beta-propeller protein/VCBS repeat-containing protein
MRCATSIGRVGGLAVALGIGISIANGVASAAPSDSSKSSSEQPSSSDTASSSATDASNTSASATDATSNAVAEGAAATADPTATPAATSDAAKADTADEASAPDDATGSTSRPSDTQSEERNANNPKNNKPSRRSAAAAARTAASSDLRPRSTADTPESSPDLGTADIDAPTTRATAVRPLTSASDTTQATILTTDAAPRVPTDAAPQVEADATTTADEPSTMASGVASIVGLTPTDPSAPAAPVPAPVESPMAWVMTAAARRQLQTSTTSTAPAAVGTSQTVAGTQTFAALAAADPVNSPPESSGVTEGAPDTTTGAIAGALNVTDPDGDSITYTVANAPAGGELALNADGTFTYTPTLRTRLAAGATLPSDFDNFSVNASDGQATTNIPVTVEIYSGQMMPEGLSPLGTPTPEGTFTVGAGPTAMTTYGNTLYVANSAAGTVSAVDLTTGQVLSATPVAAAPFALAVSPDGQRLYSANSAGNSVSVIDTASGANLINIPAGAPYGVAASPTGDYIYATGIIFNSVQVIDAATYVTVASIPVGTTPIGIVVNDTGDRLFVANRSSNTVSTIDATTNQVIGTTAVGVMPQQLALSEDGSRLYVTNTGDGTVSVLDTQTLANIATIPVGPSPNAITLSRDGSLAYVVNGNNTLSVIDTATNTKVTGTVPIEAGGFGGVAVGPDDSQFYVANSNANTVRAVSLIHVDPPPATADPGTGPLFEDFTGPADSPPNPTVFNRDVGIGGPGVVSVYTDRPSNVSVDGNGNLVLTARRETVTDPIFGTWNYTSGGINTKDKLEFTYGTLSARVQFPTGQGLHPTFALFGSDIDEIGWPNAGEIDIFEMVNGPASSGSVLHGPGFYSVSAPAPVDVSDGFHTVWVRWEPDKITTGIDDQITKVFTPDDLPPGAPWTFNDRSMYAVLSYEVGGAIPPDSSTQFPASIVVDWISYEPLAQPAGVTGL